MEQCKHHRTYRGFRRWGCAILYFHPIPQLQLQHVSALASNQVWGGKGLKPRQSMWLRLLMFRIGGKNHTHLILTTWFTAITNWKPSDYKIWQRSSAVSLLNMFGLSWVSASMYSIPAKTHQLVLHGQLPPRRLTLRSREDLTTWHAGIVWKGTMINHVH